MEYDLSRLFIGIIKPHGEGRTLRWHIGSDVKGIENVSTIVHSDTLFSALCHAWVRLFGTIDLEATLTRFEDGEPPFRISSIFPAGLSTGMYFVPKPALPVPKPKNTTPFLRHAKTLREAKFIELNNLLEWLRLRIQPDPDPYDCERFYEDIDEAFQEYEDMFWVGTEIGIDTDRLGRHSPSPFYRGRSIADEVEGCAYYFLAYCPDLAYKDRLNDLIGEVSRSGIGGERSIGFGRFSAEELVEVSKVSDAWYELFDRANGERNYLLLSLCYPTEQELATLDPHQARYTLIPRRGWFDSPTGYTFKRKRCNMFSEGSFLPLDDVALQGKIADVSPETWDRDEMKALLGSAWHPIYRYGIALGIPIELREQA